MEIALEIGRPAPIFQVNSRETPVAFLLVGYPSVAVNPSSNISLFHEDGGGGIGEKGEKKGEGGR